MQLVMPKVVAMAVSTVITMLRIFPQRFLLVSMVVLVFFRVSTICHSESFLSFTKQFVIQTTEGRKNLVYIHVYAPEILRFALNDRMF